MQGLQLRVKTIMAQNRVAYFNVPSIFSPHRLTIRYPEQTEAAGSNEGHAEQIVEDGKEERIEDSAAEGVPGTEESVQVGEKRKEREAEFLEEELVLNALELAAESEVSRHRLFDALKRPAPVLED